MVEKNKKAVFLLILKTLPKPIFFSAEESIGSKLLQGVYKNNFVVENTDIDEDVEH